MMKALSLDDDIEIDFDAGKESDDEDGFIAQRKKALKRQKLKNKEEHEEDDDEFNNVFIVPDRSREERAEHKKLVEQLRAKSRVASNF